MAKGCGIPVEVQQIIVRMSPIFKKEEIALYCGVSIRSIERILQYFQTYGSVEGSKQGRQHSPRRHLRDIDVEVSFAKILLLSLTPLSFRFCLEPFDKCPTCISMSCAIPLQLPVVSKSPMRLFGEHSVGLVSQ